MTINQTEIISSIAKYDDSLKSNKATKKNIDIRMKQTCFNIINKLGIFISEREKSEMSQQQAKVEFFGDLTKKLYKKDSFTSRSIRIIKAIKLEGYRIDITTVSFSKLDILINSNKNMVNKAYFDYKGKNGHQNIDTYLVDIQEILNLAIVEKTVNVYSKKEARKSK